MDENQYLAKFSESLESELLKVCRTYGFADDRILENDDIDSKFTEELAQEYFIDAVKEFNNYPEAALAWSGYMGMGAARLWDVDFQAFKAVKYGHFKGVRGFDDLDEHVIQSILGYELDSEPAKKIAQCLSSCAITALGLIRHEHIEPQSPRAYYVFARSVQSLYRLGASMELHILGYKFEKIG